MQVPKNDVYTVSRLNGEVRQLLEGQLGRIWLTGEISNFSSPSSGHWYLTLKDSHSQLRCAMFKGRNTTVAFKPINGQQVLVRGSISVYEPRGDYQLLIEAMFPAGDGLLAAQFEALKMKLAAEGLFAQDTKRTLPESIQRIGVITSPTGAAIRDVLHVLKRRDPSIEVVIYPTAVQGSGADKDIIRAIELANERLEVDVLLLTRGGGSLEDLWCFNSEALAHAIYNSALTIVSAVGHEVDTSIADFVADVRAPTPSAGAELLSGDQSHKLQKLAGALARLTQGWRHYALKRHSGLIALQSRLDRQDPKRQLQQQSQRLDELELRLTSSIQRRLSSHILTTERLKARLERHSPAQRLMLERQRLSYLDERLKGAMDDMLEHAQTRLGGLSHSLASVSPLATLSRGYSITRGVDGKVLTHASSMKAGDTLETQLEQGSLLARVIEVKPE
ncbi:exodeoxyribonuclease VII large subunit [Shewanella zhangzhouensis]|uniref:exodeoxyribonuclease VII large subunit n=1 Tax=Shewanella zhangzhouensis TaxID=2864213 RepID=UPI001C65DC1E|nr:exodeoxyribonuclease VII large subunit [Shewanella zhangzhouensis]QYK04016.1 exodeoxyribonuclease VII large subunit [Shewanella zhangzhouensis]